jgi:hypothetical protein
VLLITSQVTSSSLAVFSEARLRLISDRLGHNEVRVIIAKIADVIKAHPNRIKPNAYTTTWHRIALSPVALCRVSADEAKSYVNAYFDSVHPVYPFLNREEFVQNASDPNLDQCLENHPAFSALYHAVLALGSQYVGQGSFDSGTGRGGQLFQVSLRLLPHLVLPPDSLANFQVCFRFAPCGLYLTYVTGSHGYGTVYLIYRLDSINSENANCHARPYLVKMCLVCTLRNH